MPDLRRRGGREEGREYHDASKQHGQARSEPALAGDHQRSNDQRLRDRQAADERVFEFGSAGKCVLAQEVFLVRVNMSSRSSKLGVETLAAKAAEGLMS